ncbi:MAG: hypothetical protein Q8P18_20730 [Pseudomonadota bacterium]|nr:hypothetical protein [Pseudomonadota bacterium]
MHPTATLAIASTWEGGPAAPGELATLVLVARDDGLHLSFDAPLHDDPPPAAPPGALWGLWEHEVVELFVLGAGDRYTEIELGPHGHHLLLRLDGRRNVVERLLPVEARWSRGEGRWRVECVLPEAVLPPRPRRFNAYAIHGIGAARRYLAWSPVPGDQPDFHRLECFREVPEIDP